MNGLNTIGATLCRNRRIQKCPIGYSSDGLEGEAFRSTFVIFVVLECMNDMTSSKLFVRKAKFGSTCQVRMTIEHNKIH